MKPTRVSNEIAKEIERDLGTLISMPQSFLEDWREDLDSALVLLQEIKRAMRDMPAESSVLDGAHALVYRVMDHISNLEKQTDKRALVGAHVMKA